MPCSLVEELQEAIQFTHLPLTRFGFGEYLQPIVSADDGSVELLAALVYSPSEKAVLSTAMLGRARASWYVDGPAVGHQLGVKDPEGSLGIGAMWGMSGVVGTSAVSSNTWGTGDPGSGVAGEGEEVGSMDGVAEMIELLCYDWKSTN